MIKIGKYESVHGWNPKYRYDPTANPETRFQSFIFQHNRPTNFHNMIVTGEYDCKPFLDHQGHIVPQNMLQQVLDPIAAAVFGAKERPKTIVELNTFLTTNYSAMNFQNVTNYINDVLIAKGGANSQMFIDPDENDIEDFVGGYFSVIIWNPINICRAPGDNRREGIPGPEIDVSVINYITSNASETGVTLLPGMVVPFKSILRNQNDTDIASFISNCNNSLINQTMAPAGYYQFSWENPIQYDNIVPV